MSFGLVLGKMAKEIIQSYGKRQAKNKEEEKKNRFLEAYKAKLTDEHEKNAMMFFQGFIGLKLKEDKKLVDFIALVRKGWQTDKSKKRVREKIVDLEKKYEKLKSYGSSKKEKEKAVIEAKLYVNKYQKMIQDDPDFESRVFNHFYVLEEQIRTIDEPPAI